MKVQEHPNLVSKLVMNPLFWILSVGFFFSYPIYRSIGRSLPPELPKLGAVSLKNIVDEHARSITELSPKVTLVQVVPGRCVSIEECRPLYSAMAKIQKRLKGVGKNVRILSLYPPGVSKDVRYEISRAIRSNAFIWRFAGGETESLVQHLESLSKERPERGLHLLDENAEFRGFYRLEKIEIDQMMIDLGLLINRSRISSVKS